MCYRGKGENEKQRMHRVGGTRTSRFTAGRLQRGDGVVKYMLVMQLFQKAIDSEVPREYGVPVLSGGRRLCVLWMKVR